MTRATTQRLIDELTEKAARGVLTRSESYALQKMITTQARYQRAKVAQAIEDLTYETNVTIPG